MINLMRYNFPIRKFNKKYANYRSYKKYLKADFFDACGYCGDHDKWGGGSNFFHIDHFAPKSLFPTLENDYNNLIYACPFCNISKSDAWPTNDHTISHHNDVGFIDPCSSEYDQHFARDSDGSIVPTTELGKYMHKELKFFLKRHKIIWNLERLKNVISDLQIQIEALNFDVKMRAELLESYFELNREFHSYMDYLSEE